MESRVRHSVEMIAGGLHCSRLWRPKALQVHVIDMLEDGLDVQAQEA
jgi:hypothetical protein